MEGTHTLQVTAHPALNGALKGMARSQVFLLLAAEIQNQAEAWPNTYLSGQGDGVGVQTVSQLRVQLEGWCDLHNLSEK